MALEFATLVRDGVEYSFALEYDGPPITGELPRAVPINMDRIPVASAVSPIPFPDKLPLPVVQPIAASDLLGKKLPKDLRLSSSSVVLLNVSPTSVIPSESRNNDGNQGSYSKELGLGTEASVSPSSISNTGEREPENNNDISCLSFDLGSDFECCNLPCEGLNENERTYVCHDRLCELIGAIDSSGVLESSDSFDKSRELSGTLHKPTMSCSLKDKMELNDSNRTDWLSNESVLSVDYMASSSRISSRNFGDGNYDSIRDVKQGLMVKFRDIQSDDECTIEEFSRSESQVVRGRKQHAGKVKKGACYRCFKGNRFSEKEVCLVCDAKYCSDCVLRAMGSMPEGRKCVTCIGYPISESKRSNLGKCSRMLKRLLNDLEVQQIMKAEKMCEVNQLPPEYICVNGITLCNEELIMLQNCSYPPKKLKPGRYWYDKVSGLWGKEGQKPLQLITPHLNVGGPIKADASNGNAGVYINGREITKVELRMLKLAGVQCAGNPHFWVNEDGSYQEEGQKNTKGYLWGKAGTKLLCAVLSLPIPSKSTHSCEENVSGTTNRSLLVPDYIENRGIHKLLFFGVSGSGTSTIMEQAKILYKDIPFSEDELEHLKWVIQCHVYRYIGVLLEGREHFEEEISKGQVDEACEEKKLYSLSPRLKAFSDWFLKTMASGTLEAIFPAATREYSPLIEELWRDGSVQATYKRKAELVCLPSVASYFLERVTEVLKSDYKPSNRDILYAEKFSSSSRLYCMDFSFPESPNDDDTDSWGDLHDNQQRFQLIRLQAKGFGENCKWLQMFEDIEIVILTISLNDYDQLGIGTDGHAHNKMLLSKKFFENMVTHPTFQQMNFLLLLSKYDLFEDKIERVPLSQCDWFRDFNPVLSSSNSINAMVPSLGQMGFHYIAVKFKRLYSCFTDRKLYISLVNGLEPKSVDAALRYAREILHWGEEKPDFGFNEYSVYSTEASSFSH